MSVEDTKRQVIELAKEGYLLPMCPECDMVLHLREVLDGKCDMCSAEFVIEGVLWSPAHDFPDA